MKKRILAFVCVVALLIPMLLSCDMFDERESTTPEEEITPAESTTPEESTTPGENTIPGETTTPEVVTTAPPPIETTTPERVTVAPPLPVDPPENLPEIDLSRILEEGLRDMGTIVASVRSLGKVEGIPDKTIQIDGKEYHLKYQESRYWVFYDQIVDYYFVDGDSARRIYLDREGNVRYIGFSYKYLDISDRALPMQVLELLREELEEEFHLSQYQNVKTPHLGKLDSRESFGSYTFTFYNTNDGYCTDRAIITVKDNGAISSVTIYDCPVSDVELNIDRELEHWAIELEFRDRYSRYKGYYAYKYPDDPAIFAVSLVVCDGTIYVRHMVLAKIYDYGMKDTSYSFMFALLIPIDMISKK